MQDENSPTDSSIKRIDTKDTTISEDKIYNEPWIKQFHGSVEDVQGMADSTEGEGRSPEGVPTGMMLHSSRFANPKMGFIFNLSAILVKLDDYKPHNSKFSIHVCHN